MFVYIVVKTCLYNIIKTEHRQFDNIALYLQRLMLYRYIYIANYNNYMQTNTPRLLFV